MGSLIHPAIHPAIHPTAIIDSSAVLAPGVSVGAYAVIGPEVSLGEGTWVGPHAVIMGPSVIGRDNKIFQFASVGEGPQDKKFSGEKTRLIMGDRNVIRECATIHRGTIQDRQETKIGSDNLFMAYSHVAHDCILGDHNILVNSATLAGHVHLGDHVIISAFCAVHQFCSIGSSSFLSHASLVSKDVLPYMMVTGADQPTVCGLNVEGLKRRGFSPECIELLRRAYKIIFRESLRAVEALDKLKELKTELEAQNLEQKSIQAISLLIQSLESSERGILR